MKILFALAIACLLSPGSMASELNDDIKSDYDDYLSGLFDHFHRNPELSLVEQQTAARMARELRAAGFDVTGNVGGLGVVAMMKNGPGPMVMMRADMDGLAVEEMPGRASPADGIIFGDAGPCDAVKLAGLQGDLDILPWQGDRDDPEFRKKAACGREGKDALALQIGQAVDRLLGGKVARVPRPG